MGLNVKGILSFPTLFTPKIAKGATDPKFSCTILLPPGDPQIAQIQSVVDTEAQNGYPNGLPAGTDCCFQPYDQKYQGKDYYDPRFSGYMALSCTAKAEDRPPVVTKDSTGNIIPINDPGAVYSGCIATVHLGITCYTKGKGGIGGWLNGVLFEGEEGAMGRLDGKPTVEQMFQNAPVADTNVAAAAAPSPPGPQSPAGPVHQMTAKAQFTYEQYMATPGWTDELLIAQGLMLPPGGVTPSFV